MINKALCEALDYCASQNLGLVVLAIPFNIAHADERELRDGKHCAGLVLTCPSPDLTADSSDEWLGCFEAGGHWRLPRCSGPIVLVGSHMLLSQAMAATLVRSGRREVICKLGRRYGRLPIYRFALWQAGERFVQWIGGLSQNNVIRRIFMGLAGNPLLLGAWTRIFKRQGLAAAKFGSSAHDDEALYRDILRRAEQCQAIEPIEGRVVLVNAGLAAGGAERQIVNTLIGLKDSGRCESASLLAEYLDHAPDLDFFLGAIDGQGIEVSQIERHVSVADEGLSKLPAELADALAELPPSILEEVLNLIEELRRRRPEVVHAWQDSTSIKAGLAAAIAGVPRIVLAGRNMAPTNFAYIQDYMRPAYRALSQLDKVTFLNNSLAGADDYARWLDLPRARFRLLRNGVDLNYLERASQAERYRYRRALGIPDGARVLGSVFRFWEEKQPLLWLKTAERVARERADAHFLVVGEGPLREEMEAFVSRSALKGRIHLPGARPEVALPLSAMDAFMLTSKFEGTPNVVLEAQWMGLPVISTDAGGAREAVAQGVTGWISGTDSPDELASIVLQVFGDAEARRRAQEEGRPFVEANFGIDRMIEETLAAYGLDADRRCVATGCEMPALEQAS